MPAVFAVAVFLAASLLFLVEPMVARLILPYLGGSAAVWNTSFLFFQVVLLLGYLYAHGLQRRLSPKAQVAVHAAVLVAAGFALPPSVPSALLQSHPDAPVRAVLAALFLMVFSPFLAVSTTGPLLQRWFAGTSHPAGRDPYFLYAASNAGSLAGLLLYPLALEPLLGLADQARLWAAGYGVLCALVLGAGLFLVRHPGEAPSAVALPAPPPTSRDVLRWVGLSLLPSALCLSTTSTLSTDVAAVPLLWVLPLSLYLLTFVLAFSRVGPAATRMAGWFLVPTAAGSTLTLVLPLQDHLPEAGLAHLAFLFAASLALHGRLSATRPAPTHLTAFYLWISVGGALGGFFTSVVAPQLFRGLGEHPLLVVAATAAALLRCTPGRRPLRLAAVAAWAGLVAWLAGIRSTEAGEILHQSRTFYGRHVVATRNDGAWHVLKHGTTVHGVQAAGDLSNQAAAYYHPTSPIGQVFQALDGDPRRVHVAVVGLGAGSLAAYAENGQQFTFYELDPEVLRIARNPAWFTFLYDADRTRGADVRVVLGDGRLGLQEATDGTFGLLILDAFSSDAIPVHLLTEEALRLYARKTAPDGLIAFHVSNSYFHLRPVLSTLAGRLGLQAFVQYDDNPQGIEDGKQRSEWVVLARRVEDVAGLLCGPRPPGARPWQRMDPVGAPYDWTDDHANALAIYRGLGPQTPALANPVCPD